MKKIIKITCIILILLAILLVPIRSVYKDGGTVVYQAVLWEYFDYHIMLYENDRYFEATQFNIFPFKKRL